MVDTGCQKPSRRWARRGLLLLAVGLLGAVPAANVVLMVPAVKSRVEGKLSAVAGSRVTAGSIRYWPWSGVLLREVRVADGGRVPGVVAVEEVLVDVALGSVFSEDLEVPLIRVVRPLIDIEWKKVAPVVVAGVGEAEERPAVEEVPRTRREAATGDVPPVVVVAGGGQGETGGAKPAAGRVERGRRLVLGVVEVVDGAVAVELAGSTETALRVVGIDVDADFSRQGDGGGGGEVIGKLATGVVEGGGRLIVEGVAGEVVIEGSAIRVRGLQAEAGGGVLEGEAAVVLGAGGLPFEFAMKGKGINLGEVAGAGFEGFLLSGVLDGEVKVGGYGTVPESWRGQGGFKIAELEISGGGTAVVLKPAEVWGTLQGGWVNLDRFYAHSDELALRASGGAVMDGRLGVNLRVYVDRAVATAVAHKLEVLGGGRNSGMEELEGTHYAFRDVAVRGTVGEPMLVLWDDQTPVRPGDFLRCFTPEGVAMEPFVAQ